MLEYLSFVSVFPALSHSVTHTLWNKFSSCGMCSIYRIVPSMGEIAQSWAKRKKRNIYINGHQSTYYRQKVLTIGTKSTAVERNRSVSVHTYILVRLHGGISL